jgi:hypothetical protein
MRFAEFQKLVSELSLARETVEATYQKDPLNPWSYREGAYPENLRVLDAHNILDSVFFEDRELDVDELSLRLNDVRQDFIDKKREGEIWSTMGNLRVSIAIAAAEEFQNRMNLSNLESDTTVGEIIGCLPESPYNGLMFPSRESGEDGEIRARSADEVAAVEIYRGNLLALLIARYKDIEEYLP